MTETLEFTAMVIGVCVIWIAIAGLIILICKINSIVVNRCVTQFYNWKVFNEFANWCRESGRSLRK